MCSMTVFIPRTFLIKINTWFCTPACVSTEGPVLSPHWWPEVSRGQEDCELQKAAEGGALWRL